MKRCLRAQLRFSLIASWVFVAGLGSLLAQAHAQVRTFPATAQVGMFEVLAPPLVSFNGQDARLSPGARIKAANNLIVQPASLVGQGQWASVVREPQGMLHEVWILRAEEVQALGDNLPVTTNFVFGSQVDQTPRDDGKTPFDQLPKFQQQ